jgi:uncharacterized protein
MTETGLWPRRAWLLLAALAVTAGPAQADEVAYLRAVGVDNDRAVRRLLEAGADPNQRNAQGQPVLFLALRDEAFKVAALLLAQPGLQVDATTAADETALMMAALKGHVDWVRRLIEAGAAVNRPGWTPLHYAASGGSADAVALLLERGAAIDAPSPNRSTPLMMAARYGASESVELLLARGADPRPLNERGLSAADFARSAGRDALAERLARLATSPPAR